MRGDQRMHISSRRALTLVELVVVMALVLILAGIVYGAYGPLRQGGNDRLAQGLADQVAHNLADYAALNGGAYPASLGRAQWATLISSLGSYAELPATAPAIVSGTGAFVAYTDSTGSTFQLLVQANNGTASTFCRDPNGLASVSWQTGNGPWTGCP